MQRLDKIFTKKKPIIGMVHLRPLPGSPLYDPASMGMKKILETAKEEAKMLEDKPFMKLREKIEGCDLYPKETIVVDYPKLQSYIARAHSDGHIPTYVVWHLGRPCADIGGITIFQNIL